MSEPKIDYAQACLNGGSYCFHIEEGKYCGRGVRWAGHNHPKEFHSFVESPCDHLRAKVEAMQHVVNCASVFAGWNEDEEADDRDSMVALFEAVDEYRRVLAQEASR